MERAKENRDWKSHLGNWGIYAAAAGASLSMATSADAGIISGTLNVTGTINPAAGVNASAEPGFVIGGANEGMFLRNSASHTAPGGGTCSTSVMPGHGSCRVSLPRAGEAGLEPGLFNGRQLKFFDNSFNERARRYLRNSVIAGGAPNIQQTAFLDTNVGGARHGNFPFGTTNDFVGFKTASGDLGWLQVEVLDRNSDGYPDQVEAIAYGYNTVAGASIIAGQTGSAPATPEPGTASLALLAAGAAGILALRQARRARTEVRSMGKHSAPRALDPAKWAFLDPLTNEDPVFAARAEPPTQRKEPHLALSPGSLFRAGFWRDLKTQVRSHRTWNE